MHQFVFFGAVFSGGQEPDLRISPKAVKNLVWAGAFLVRHDGWKSTETEIQHRLG